MTYRQLLHYLQILEEDESDKLDMHVTVYDEQNEEYYPINYADNAEGVDVLDDDHPILVFVEEDRILTPGE